MEVVSFVENVGEVRNRWDHMAIAADLRKKPGAWALVDLPTFYAPRIRRGKVRAFQPDGAYEAMVRGNRLYVRFVGGDVPPEVLAETPVKMIKRDASAAPYVPYGQDKRTKYDHEAIREAARAEKGEWVLTTLPQSYTTGITRYGRWGYTLGEWEASYRRGVGVVVRHVVEGLPAAAPDAPAAPDVLDLSGGDPDWVDDTEPLDPELAAQMVFDPAELGLR